MRPPLLAGFLLLPAASLLPAQTEPLLSEAEEMDEVVISSTPLGRTLRQQTLPVSVLEGRELRQAVQPGIGDTLSRLPGVSSTGFAPGASRPVIRGLGEDRIRLLHNGSAVLDVSNVSPDHAVTADPLLLDRVEVVRGPAALLHGANAIGGVVNLIDGRIPEERVEPGPAGLPVSGRIDGGYGSGADLWSGAGVLDFNLGPVVIHLDGFRREAGDMTIPGQARSARLRKLEPLEHGEREVSGTLPNSFTESEGGAAGASWLWDGGYAGLSWSFLSSDYGTVADERVTIGLDQERWDAAGAFYSPFAGLREVRYRVGWSDYSHTEFEGPEVGTVFNIRGYDARVEAVHEKTGGLEGTFGYHTTRSEFSASGEEAFLPESETTTHSAFWLEELETGRYRWQAGLRYDRSTVESPGFGGRGGEAEFDALSGSAGVVARLPHDWTVAFNAALTRRAPTYVELLAGGPHLATGAWETGNPDLGLEKSLGLDLTLRKNAGFVTGSAGIFYNRFSDYIGLVPTGRAFEFQHGGEEEEPGHEEGHGEEEDGEEHGHGHDAGELPEYAYRAMDADFAGGELEVTFHLLRPAEAEESTAAGSAGKGKTVTAGPAQNASGARAHGRQLDLELKADYVHTTVRSGGSGPLPRIAPFRTSAALIYEDGPFTARLEGQYHAPRHRTAEHELPTDSFFLLNAGLSWRITEGPVSTELFVRGTNLLDEEARLHTSFLKDIAPLEGRAVMTGVRISF